MINKTTVNKYQGTDRDTLIKKIEVMGKVLTEAKQNSASAFKYYNDVKRERELLVDLI